MVTSAAQTFSVLIGLLLGLLVPLATATAQDATPAATSTTGVTREVLNTDLPEMSPGYALTLTRVVIEPGGVAAAHFHPGTQLIYIESGVVLYTVLNGELPFMLAGEDGQPGVEGVLRAGETMEFGPGDRFIEHKDMIHVAENRGDAPVVILAASLLGPSLPASIPIDVEAPATPAP